MFKKFLLATLLTLIPSLTFGQTGYVHNDVVLDENAHPVPLAVITVCSGFNIPGQPCSPAVTTGVFTDSSFTTLLNQVTNPILTDGSGNYTIYVSPGAYTVSYSRVGFPGKSLNFNFPCVNNNCIGPGGGSGAFTYVTVPFSSTPNFNGTSNTGYAFILTGNAVATFASPTQGTIYTFNFCQDGIGGHTLTFPSNVKVPTGFVLASAPNICTQVSFIFDGNNWQPWQTTGSNSQSHKKVLDGIQFTTVGAAATACLADSLCNTIDATARPDLLGTNASFTVGSGTQPMVLILPPGTLLMSGTLHVSANSAIDCIVPASFGVGSMHTACVVQAANNSNISSVVSLDGYGAAIRNTTCDGNKANNPTGGVCVLVNKAQSFDLEFGTAQNAPTHGIWVSSTLTGNESCCGKIHKFDVSNNNGDGIYGLNTADIFSSQSQHEVSGLSATVNTTNTLITATSGSWSTDSSLIGTMVRVNHAGLCQILGVPSTTTLTVSASTCWNTSGVPTGLGVQTGVRLSIGTDVELNNSPTWRMSTDDFAGGEVDGILAYGTNAGIGANAEQLSAGSQFGNAVDGHSIEVVGSCLDNQALSCSQGSLVGGNGFFMSSFIPVGNTFDKVHLIDGGNNAITGNYWATGTGTNQEKAAIEVVESSPGRALQNQVGNNSFAIIAGSASAFGTAMYIDSTANAGTANGGAFGGQVPQSSVKVIDNSGVVDTNAYGSQIFSFTDQTTASNLSKQALRIIYTRDVSATGAVTTFDSVLDLANPQILSNAPYILRGLTVEGPSVSSGKTLNSWEGLHFSAPIGSGTVTTKSSIVVDTGGGIATFNDDINLGNSGFLNTLSNTLTSNRTTTFPDNSGTVAETNFAQTFSVNQTLTNTSQLRFLSTNGTNYAGFQGGASTSNLIWLFPTTDSSGTQCLSSNGSLQLSWSACSAGTGTPGGATTQVQFNNAGSFGASSNLTWTSPALSVGAASTATGQIKYVGTTSGTVTTQSQDAAGTWTFKWPTSGGTANFPLITDGTGVASWTLLPVAGGGSGGSTFNVNQLLAGNGTLPFQSITGTLTGTNPVLTLTSASTSSVPFAVNTPASPTADLFDLNINSVKTSWFDSAGTLHAPSFVSTGAGPAVIAGNEGTCPSPASGQDIICLGDSSSHSGQLSNNGVSFKSIVQWTNTAPTAHGLVVAAPTGAAFPQQNSISACNTGIPVVGQGTSADPICSSLGVIGGGTGITTATAHGVLLGEGTSPFGVTTVGVTNVPLIGQGASADPIFGAIPLNSAGVSGILPIANGGTGSSTLAGASIATVTGTITPGDCVKFSAATVITDFGAGCGSVGSVAMSAITAATASNTINSTVNPQTWNWALTGSTTAFQFGENTAATGSNNILLSAHTLSGSTAIPFSVDNAGNGWQLSSTGRWQPLGTGSIKLSTGLSDVTGQSTSQSAVTLASSPTSDKYQLSYYADVSTACTTGGNSVSFVFNWTDGTAARSLQTGSLSMASGAPTGSAYLSGLFPLQVGSGNVTYTSTVSGSCASGTSTYDVHVSLIRVQ